MKKWLSVLLVALLLPALTVAQGNTATGDTPVSPTDSEKENTMKVTIGEKTFDVTLENNETAEAFAALLPMDLSMSELNGNEKYHYLMGDLPANPQRVGRVEAGDLMLFGDDCVVLFYKSFNTGYSYTRIGQLDDVSGLEEAVGGGSVLVKMTR